MARHKTLEDIFVVRSGATYTLLPYCCQGFFPTNVNDGVPWTQDDTDRRKLHGKPYSMFTMGFGFWVLLHPAATSSSQFEWGSQFRKSHSSSGFGGRAQLTLAVFHVSRTVERLQRSLRCLSFVSGSIRALVLQVMPSMFQEPVLCAEAWPAVSSQPSNQAGAAASREQFGSGKRSLSESFTCCGERAKWLHQQAVHATHRYISRWTDQKCF